MWSNFTVKIYEYCFAVKNFVNIGEVVMWDVGILNDLPVTACGSKDCIEIFAFEKY